MWKKNSIIAGYLGKDHMYCVSKSYFFLQAIVILIDLLIIDK